MSQVVAEQQPSPQSYKTDEHPIWCPGCGDFGVLDAMYKALAGMKIASESK